MNRDSGGFVTGGIWCLDRNITVSHWPGEDMATTALDVRRSGGGSSCNFALDLRKLDPGVRVETMGLLGNDSDGDFLQALAEQAGMQCRFSRTSEAPTQVTDAYQSQASGRRTHVLFKGAGDLLSPDHFDFSWTTGRFFHLGLPGIHATMDGPWQADANGWVTVLRRAREAGLHTNMELVAADPALIRRLVLPCLPHLTTLVINDHEIGALAETRTLHDGRPLPAARRDAARLVLKKGAMDLVVVHHMLGAHLVSRDGLAVDAPSVQVPEDARKGANGAGDAFAAGFFYGRYRGWPPGDCLRMGHATAAACLRAPGPSDAVEHWETCLALASSWGWRDDIP